MNPGEWVDHLKQVDAVVHAASVWNDDLESEDQTVVTALLQGLNSEGEIKALIYTGGCWLFGSTGNSVATEDTPLNPIPSYLSTRKTMQLVLSDTNIRGMVVHPAMVYEHRGGVFERMYEEVSKLGHVRVFGDLQTCWPLVHRVDLAQLYALMAEGGDAGDVFNASSIEGVAIGDIARAISVSAGCPDDPVVYDIETATSEFGEWAVGFVLDQQMSGQKAMTELSWSPKHVDVFEDIS